MNKLKFSILLLLGLFLTVFYACNEDEFTELTTENETTEASAKLPKNGGDCEYEENVFDAFCYDPSPADIYVVKNLRDDLPPGYISFDGNDVLETELSKVTPLVYERNRPAWLKITERNQQTYVYAFMENGSKRATFYVSTPTNHYVLTASDHWYINEMKEGAANPLLMRQIKEAMNGGKGEINGDWGGIKDEGELETIGIGAGSISIQGVDVIGAPGDYALVRACDNFKTRTIDKYIKTWGIEEYLADDNIRGIISGAFGEQHVDLNNVGYDCGDMCVDPIQLTKTFLSFISEQAYPGLAEIVKRNTIVSVLGLNIEELETSLITNVFDNIVSSSDFCLDSEVYDILLTQLVENPNLIDIITNLETTNDIVISEQNPICPEMFMFAYVGNNTNPSVPIPPDATEQEAGIENLTIQLTVNGETEIFYFPYLIFEVGESSINCDQPHAESAANAINQGIINATNAIQNGNLFNNDIRFTLWLEINRAFVQNVRECFAHFSGFSAQTILWSGFDPINPDHVNTPFSDLQTDFEGLCD